MRGGICWVCPLARDFKEEKLDRRTVSRKCLEECESCPGSRDIPGLGVLGGGHCPPFTADYIDHFPP